MQLTLILLAAAGQVVTAIDPHFSHSPRAATPTNDKPLATITALSDGHLPTCFTGHPTHPCPTNGPEGKRDVMGDLAGNPVEGLTDDVNEVARIVPIEQIELTASGGKPALPTDGPKVKDARDASTHVANKDYIPHPSEWAIPGNFKFTDSVSHKDWIPHPSEWAIPGSFKFTDSIAHKGYIPHPSEWAFPGKFKFTDSIDHDATSSTGDAASMADPCSEESDVAPKAVAPQPEDNVDHYNKHSAHQHSNVHHNKHQGDHLGREDTYAHTSAASKPTPAKSYSQTTNAPALSSVSGKEQHAVVNASSEGQFAASIGTLLSAAMLPGMMRQHATTNTSPHAAVVTPSKDDTKVNNKPGAYSTTQVQKASTSTPCTSSQTPSGYSTGSAYDIKPVTMLTSPRPASSSEAQPTASSKAAETAQLQHTAKHFVS